MAAPRCFSKPTQAPDFSPAAKSKIAGLQSQLVDEINRSRSLTRSLRAAERTISGLETQVAAMRRELAWRDRESIPRRVAEAMSQITQHLSQ